MKKLISREMVLVTPEDAKRYLGYNNYIVQRAVRPAHTNELASKINRGDFRFGEIALASINGCTYMLNGQHVCNAIILSGRPQECVIERFKCDNELDMSDLFRQFEILPRSQSDMLTVEKHALELDWPVRFASLLVAAASLLEAGNAKFTQYGGPGSSRVQKYVTKEMRVKFLRRYISEGVFVKSIVEDIPTPNDAKHMRRAAIVAMMILTQRKSEQDARRFWEMVRDGERLTKTHPAWHLREFLKSHHIISHRYSVVNRKASNHEMAYRTALTWNAFRRGINISKTSYFPEKGIPKII